MAAWRTRHVPDARDADFRERLARSVGLERAPDHESFRRIEDALSANLANFDADEAIGKMRECGGVLISPISSAGRNILAYSLDHKVGKDVMQFPAYRGPVRIRHVYGLKHAES